ncbi:hypothetical protein EW026_g7398 [Hermanssonia centrifuga]|uniref:Uncharacterized protein n=1 Tax=Hermanssonia centrifuga TaxID=98765 RepID=A0A4S4K9R4_9APHY|nr:hypothetical protein EW026_g7398 [Hermanssonia centrifuga]
MSDSELIAVYQQDVVNAFVIYALAALVTYEYIITPSLQIGSPVINIAGTLQPILTSRFLLNLRQAGEPKNETNETFNSRFTVPGFRVPTLASIIDNIGEDLDHGLTEEVDEMMESNNNISAASQASVEHANTVEEIQEIPREVIF